MTLQIRPALPDDARLLWEWRNDPVVRANSFYSDPIPWETHQVWYVRKLASPTTRIYIMEKRLEGPVGQIRFERRDPDVAEVHLAVASQGRGRGYGREMLVLALPLAQAALGVRRFEAVVKSGNAGSLGLFRSAGFAVEEEVTLGGCPTVKVARTWSAEA